MTNNHKDTKPMGACLLYEMGKDTAGNPIFRIDCKCGTTSCQQVRNLTVCEHHWYECEPETDNIKHCHKCGVHNKGVTDGN